MLVFEDPKVLRLAQAIAKAEGFGPPQNLPTRINNPGDLELGDKGFGVKDGKTIFQELSVGWYSLQYECWLMLTGNSHFYNPIKTFFQVAQTYTGGDNALAWAEIVSSQLGMKVSNTLRDYLSGP